VAPDPLLPTAVGQVPCVGCALQPTKGPVSATAGARTLGA